MFAYCGNNPVNSADPRGAIAGALLVQVSDVLLDAAIGGVINAATTFAVTASWDETVKAFAVGAINGAIYSLFDEIQILLVIGEGLSTSWNCYSSGASIAGSLLAGGVAIYADLSFGSVDNKVANLVIGTGMSLISESTTQAVLQTSHSKQTSNPAKSKPSRRNTSASIGRARSVLDRELTL